MEGDIRAILTRRLLELDSFEDHFCTPARDPHHQVQTDENLGWELYSHLAVAATPSTNPTNGAAAATSLPISRPSAPTQSTRLEITHQPKLLPSSSFGRLEPSSNPNPAMPEISFLTQLHPFGTAANINQSAAATRPTPMMTTTTQASFDPSLFLLTPLSLPSAAEPLRVPPPTLLSSASSQFLPLSNAFPLQPRKPKNVFVPQQPDFGYGVTAAASADLFVLHGGESCTCPATARMWKRLRLKKGTKHYLCQTCGAKWKISKSN